MPKSYTSRRKQLKLCPTRNRVIVMNYKDEFKVFLTQKKSFSNDYADDIVSHINRISSCYEVRIGDLFDPNTISMFGRLDDDTMENTDYERWMKALRYYIEFLKQL